MSAYGRAFHADEKSPIFADTVAKKLFTKEEFEQIGEYISGGLNYFAPEKKDCFESREEALRYLVDYQIAPTPVARAKFCEDALKISVRAGVKQYVILGAGFDTFALRDKSFIKNYKVFEVDHPKTQEDKIKRIERAGLVVPPNLTFVSVDFGEDDLKDKLLKYGFDPEKKSFFSWLGVSFYLTAREIEKTLADVAELSADGSDFVFDYADENLFDSKTKRVKNMIETAAAGGEPMKTCFDYSGLEKTLEKYGFLIYEHLTSADIQNQYFKGTDMTAFEHINFVHAVHK